MKKFIYIIAVMLLAFLFAGCSSTSSSSMKWTPTELNGLKGKTMEEISSVYGQPTQRYSVNDGRQVWEYRQESSGNAINTISKISTFGIVSGNNNVYVDVLRIYFHNNRVTQTALDENVIGYLTQGGANIQHPQESAPTRQETVHRREYADSRREIAESRQEAVVARHEKVSAVDENKSDTCQCECKCEQQPTSTITKKKKMKTSTATHK